MVRDFDGLKHSPREDAEPKTVLVVEDDVLTRLSIAESLRISGFRVIEASSGDEAVMLLQGTHSVDLVFTDNEMPGKINGVALAQWLKVKFPQIICILTSGRIPVAPLPIAFVEKPYAPDQVVAQIRTIFDGLCPGP